MMEFVIINEPRSHVTLQEMRRLWSANSVRRFHSLHNGSGAPRREAPAHALSFNRPRPPDATSVSIERNALSSLPSSSSSSFPPWSSPLPSFGRLHPLIFHGGCSTLWKQGTIARRHAVPLCVNKSPMRNVWPISEHWFEV